MNEDLVPRDAVLRGPVVLINAFTVPLDESERFLDRWKDNARAIAKRPGLLRARLYRALDQDVELRFINVAEWKSREALSEATGDPDWRAAVQRMLDDPSLHIVPRPAIYEVAVELGPGADSGEGSFCLPSQG